MHGWEVYMEEKKTKMGGFFDRLTYYKLISVGSMMASKKWDCILSDHHGEEISKKRFRPNSRKQ